jgi:hypothetical protein
MRPWLLVLGAVLVAAGIGALVLAHDLHGWDRALERGDAAAAEAPATARWEAAPWLPGDAAGELLGLDDDVRLRRALVAFSAARGVARGFDNGARAARARAGAEVALADVVARGAPSQAAQAGNLLGVLVAASGSGADASVAEDRAAEIFASAVGADPAVDDAKYNLELLLRRIRVVGTREGPGRGTGNRGDSRRGAGAGVAGEGY